MKSMNTTSIVAAPTEPNENITAAHAPESVEGGAAAEPAATGAQPADAAAALADAPTAAATAPAAGADAQSPRALLKQLQQQFPAFRDCLPLAIGIDKQVLARLPNLNRKTMRAALGIHVGSMRYLRAMEKATVRFDLDGNPGAEVTDTHRLHAKEQLQQRFKKEAERKKAERDAALQAEADKKRQEKLELLASKFARR
jgi:ProP effector